jgi:hypothetical protein
MSYVTIPKDLAVVKTKVALNLTKRQLVCFSCAAVLGIPVYLLTRHGLGNSGAVLLMMGLMLPFFFLAMYERNGQPAEKLLLNYLRVKLFWPGIRPYMTENYYEMLESEVKTNAAHKKSKGKK